LGATGGLELAGADLAADGVVWAIEGLRALALTWGVLDVKRVASATLRGVPSTAIGMFGHAFEEGWRLG
jgi:hypothetical protein